MKIPQIRKLSSYLFEGINKLNEQELVELLEEVKWIQSKDACCNYIDGGIARAICLEAGFRFKALHAENIGMELCAKCEGKGSPTAANMWACELCTRRPKISPPKVVTGFIKRGH